MSDDEERMLRELLDRRTDVLHDVQRRLDAHRAGDAEQRTLIGQWHSWA